MTNMNDQEEKKAELLMEEYQRFFVPATDAVAFESHARFEIYSAYPEKAFVISDQASPRRVRRA